MAHWRLTGWVLKILPHYLRHQIHGPDDGPSLFILHFVALLAFSYHHICLPPTTSSSQWSQYIPKGMYLNILQISCHYLNVRVFEITGKM